jgi:hypothetical protein
MRKSTLNIVTERVRAEFLEMPGMRLTAVQVQRLCGVEQEMSELVLESLVAAKFLCRKADGAYGRMTDHEMPGPHPVRAELAQRRRSAKAS